MSFIIPPLGTLANFLAASRKPNLTFLGYFSPNQETSWIYSNSTSGSAPQQCTLTGTPNGILETFGVPLTIVNGIQVFVNGILQTVTASYSISGQNVVFTYAPQSGDSVQALVE